ncbi:MAG: protein kinase [Nanoarchaeota archaeon]|nr:protein kinase [Nanoarchaeota archaeon]
MIKMTTQIIEKKNKSGFEEISSEEWSELIKRGYTLVDLIGSGNTRNVYKSKFQNGIIDTTRAVKISKDDVGTNSIVTLINLSKRDPNENEVLYCNDLRHPSIVEVIDSFRLNGKIATVEGYYDAISLEDRIGEWSGGPIRDEKRFEHIFKQVIGALSYAHEEKEILHRDIKPSNILVNRRGDVKISDWQNARRISDIKEQALPTRGGTAYTHPDLLNALLSEEDACASKRTDLYALGATMVFALTGKDPFDYKLVKKEKGKEIQVEDKKIGIAINTHLDDITRIEEDQHKKDLKNILKEVPKKYRKTLERCLSLDKGYGSIVQLKEDFEQACKSKTSKFKEEIVGGLKKGLIIGGGILALGLLGISAYNMHTGPAYYLPISVKDMLMSENYLHTDLRIIAEEDGKALETLKGSFSDIKHRLPTIESKYDISDIVGIIERASRVNKRLSSALIRSCLLGSEENQRKVYGKSRIYPGCLPTDFYFRISSEYNAITTPPDVLTDRKKLFWTSKYLKECIPHSSNIAEIFTKYFCTSEEVFTARRKADNLSYFPIIEDNRTIKEGYGQNLPFVKKRLIDTAIAFYLITDNEGNIDLGKADQTSSPAKGLAAK